MSEYCEICKKDVIYGDIFHKDNPEHLKAEIRKIQSELVDTLIKLEGYQERYQQVLDLLEDALAGDNLDELWVEPARDLLRKSGRRGIPIPVL